MRGNPNQTVHFHLCWLADCWFFHALDARAAFFVPAASAFHLEVYLSVVSHLKTISENITAGASIIGNFA